MNFISQRVIVPERMDDPNLPEADHRLALRGLARLNRVSKGGRILLPYLRRATELAGRSITILDVATGGGDGLLPLLKASRHWQYPLIGAGCDVSETALAVARQQAVAANLAVNFFRCDATQEEFPTEYDYLLSSLFFHHLRDDQVVPQLRKQFAAARRGVLVNDLCRSSLNRVAVWLGARLLSRSPIVHFDGPASVSAALSWVEWQQLARTTGMQNVELNSHFPCRVILHVQK